MIVSSSGSRFLRLYSHHWRPNSQRTRWRFESLGWLRDFEDRTTRRSLHTWSQRFRSSIPYRGLLYRESWLFVPGLRRRPTGLGNVSPDVAIYLGKNQTSLKETRKVDSMNQSFLVGLRVSLLGLRRYEVGLPFFKWSRRVQSALWGCGALERVVYNV